MVVGGEQIVEAAVKNIKRTTNRRLVSFEHNVVLYRSRKMSGEWLKDKFTASLLAKVLKDDSINEVQRRNITDALAVMPEVESSKVRGIFSSIFKL